MTKMNPEIKAEWLERLRSGKYEQGKGNLNNNGQMCCLGVLSDMAADEGVCSRRMSDDPADRGIVHYGNEVFYLPVEVQEWAGFDKHNPSFPVDDAEKVEYADYIGFDEDKVYLAMLNDGGQTFAQIADEIEKRF